MYGLISGVYICIVCEMIKCVNFMFGILGGSDFKFYKEFLKVLVSCFCFDFYIMEWINIVLMRILRLMYSLVVFSGCLYVIGG